MNAGNTSALSYCKRKLRNANCMPKPIYQDGLLQNFAPLLRRALYTIQFIKSFFFCWNLTNIANYSALNPCRIAQPFTWEDAMSVLSHATVWYLRPPYTTKVHEAEKITSLKKTNHEDFRSRKSIKPFKTSRAWSIPSQVNAVYTQTYYFLEMIFYMFSFYA
jgi:hypothetical protein